MEKRNAKRLIIFEGNYKRKIRTLNIELLSDEHCVTKNNK